MINSKRENLQRQTDDENGAVNNIRFEWFLLLSGRQINVQFNFALSRRTSRGCLLRQIDQRREMHSELQQNR